MTPRRTYLELGDVRLCCVDFGGSSPPVLLLHGLAGRATEWQNTARWLTHKHRVYALDQRGHGDSDKPPTGYTRDAYVGDIIKVIERLGIAPATLIGQSMGGLNAFLVAARRPDLVAALIVVEATPARNPTAQTDIAKWLDHWPVPFRTRVDARRFFGGDTLYAKTWTEVLERREDGWWPQFNMQSMVESLADVTVGDYWDEWAKVRCPNLVVAGEKSGLQHHHLREMKRRVRDGTYIRIANAGHDVHLENPAEWQRAAEAFLARVTPHAAPTQA